MFLIEYQVGTFINGESVQWLEVKDSTVSFALSGYTEVFYVHKDLQCNFLNHLQAINNNINNVQSSCTEVNP